MGPEPKPIRTGATKHTLCVVDGKLMTYKLHVRTYGGRKDEDLCNKSIYTGTVQKWINLLDIVLDEYKGAGHSCTTDSAYMGDIMSLIGRYEWKIICKVLFNLIVRGLTSSRWLQP